jgi:uncharacterized protein
MFLCFKVTFLLTNLNILKMLKKSRFIYTVKHNGNILYFQGISKKFILIKNDENEQFQEILNNPFKYIKQYPNLLRILQDSNYIVDFDEIDDLRLKNKIQVYSDKHYMLTINPTLNCNVSCWYCDAHTKKETKINKDTYKKIENHIKRLQNEMTGLHLDWFGGEPLLYFNEIMYPLAKLAMDLFKNKKFTHHVTTNAILIDKEMCKKFNDIKLTSFQITLDGYKHKHDKVKIIKGKSAYETVIKNIHSILNIVENSRITLRINYDNETLKDCEKIFKEFDINERKKIHVDFQRVWQTSKKEDKNEILMELLEYCRENGYDARYPHYSPRLFHTCYSDKLFHTVINYDGRIFKCTGGFYDKSEEMGMLKENGEIEWNRNKISKMFNKATFDNEECLNCNLLSLCYGPCTKKIAKTGSDIESIKRVCHKELSEIELDEFLIYKAEKQHII